MKRIIVIGLLSLLIVGCSGGNEYTAAPDVDVPDFEVTDTQEAEQNGQTVLSVYATTEAIAAEDLRPIAQQIRSENADADGLIVTFSEPGGDAGGVGSAAAANSEQAAQQIFTPDILTGFMTEMSPEQIMNEDNGMVVVSISDEIEAVLE